MDIRKLRPALHFTVKNGYSNDPNGLIYDSLNDVYHLGYQFQTEVMPEKCYCHWGHAISKNLYDWQETLPILSPDEYGIIASGSAVIDAENTSGLFDESTDPRQRFVALYTSTNLESGRQAVCVAYSADGVNYIKYQDGKPVLHNNDPRYASDFRDPKAFFLQEDKSWLMIIGGGILKLFKSKNLIDWEYQSIVENVVSDEKSIDNDLSVLKKYLPNNDPFNKEMISECPDLFPLLSNSGEEKWILSGGGIFYTVGNLVKKDGKFYYEPISKKKRFFSCVDFFAHHGEPYATQSFYNDRFGRRIAVSWLMDSTGNKSNNKPYNGVMSLPLELSLLEKDDEYALKAVPTQEFYDNFRFLMQTSDGETSLPENTFYLKFSHCREFLISNAQSENAFSIEYNKGVLSVTTADGNFILCDNLGSDISGLIVFDKYVLSMFINDTFLFNDFVFGGSFERLKIKASNQIKVHILRQKMQSEKSIF